MIVDIRRLDVRSRIVHVGVGPECRGRSGIVGGDGGGIFLQRVEAVGVESLRRIFSLRDDDLASGLRVYADLNRPPWPGAKTRRCLGLSVEKDPPFTVDFSDASMGIAVGRGRGNGFSFGVGVASAGVDYGASVGEEYPRGLSL